jgi:hypothetical protein
LDFLKNCSSIDGVTWEQGFFFQFCEVGGLITLGKLAPRLIFLGIYSQKAMEKTRVQNDVNE